MTPVKREYRAPQRARQAKATRERIALAARELFAEQGYAATTIEAVARAADVAIQTVYATFGSKRAIVLALLDIMEEEGGVAQLQADLQAATDDPVLQIRHWVGFSRRLFERGTDLLEMARVASSVEPDVAVHVQTGEKRRRAGAEAFVRSLADTGELSAGLEQQTAVDIVWALLSPELFRLLVVQCRWTAEAYETWLVRELTQQLLVASEQAERRPEVTGM